MTEARRNVLIVAGVMAVLMALLPPWETPPRSLHMLSARILWEYPPEGSFVGYAPLFVPPNMTMLRRSGAPENRYEPCVVSWRVLVTQYAALLLVAGAAMAGLRRHG